MTSVYVIRCYQFTLYRVVNGVLEKRYRVFQENTQSRLTLRQSLFYLSIFRFIQKVLTKVALELVKATN